MHPAAFELSMPCCTALHSYVTSRCASLCKTYLASAQLKRGAHRQVHRRNPLLDPRNNASSSGDGHVDQPYDSDVPHVELPVELQGLEISGDGQYLVDSKSGKVLNEFGATRFDVAVRALRGDLDPPNYVQNTERTDHLLIGALKQFPLDYTFNIVFKGSQDHGEITEYIGRVLERVCGTSPHQCRLADRLRGKYLSVQATANIKSPNMISGVFEELDKDTRIVMKY